MQIVNVFDGDKHQHTLAVQRDDAHDAETDFVEDFHDEVRKQALNVPVDVFLVFDALRKDGWNIIDIRARVVRY